MPDRDRSERAEGGNGRSRIRRQQKAGIPRGSSGSRGGGSSNGIPKGSSSGGGGGNSNGIPKGSSGGSRGSGGGRGIPRGASIRSGGGRNSGGIPRGSKTIEDLQSNKATEQGSVEQKIDPATQVQNVTDEGRVRAIISVTGVKDQVGDVIEPGAYEKTLKTRMPRGIWSHRWHEPVSRTESIKELMPGDPDLPKTLGNGEPWPDTAGAVIVDTLFNMKTDAGRQAFENVRFFSEGGEGASSEWSIGYKATRSTKGKDGTRYIKELDLFEYSPVLHGANRHAKTLSVKSLDEAINALHIGGYDTSELDLDEGKSEQPAFDGLLASEVKDLVQAHAIIGAYLTELGVKTTAVEGDPDLVVPDDDERWVNGEAEDAPMSLYGELEQLLDPDDFAELLDLAAEFDDASDEGDDDAAGEIMSEFLDVFEAEEENDEALSALRDVVADVIDDRYPELAEDDDAYYDDDDESDEDESEDDDSEEYDDAEDAEEAEDAEPEADVEASGEKSAYWVKEIPKAKRDEMASSGSALKDGTYPIANARQLQSAIRLRTQGNAPNKVVDDHIKKRANSLNLSHMLPDSMRSGSSSSGDGGKKKPPFGKGGEKSLQPMSWGSEDATSLVMSAIEWN